MWHTLIEYLVYLPSLHLVNITYHILSHNTRRRLCFTLMLTSILLVEHVSCSPLFHLLNMFSCSNIGHWVCMFSLCPSLQLICMCLQSIPFINGPSNLLCLCVVYLLKSSSASSCCGKSPSSHSVYVFFLPKL